MNSILYHCSFQAVGQFTLRVPEHRCPGEDGKTPRICFAESIRDAVSAMPQGGQALRGMLAQQKFAPVIHVYACDRTAQKGRFIPPWALKAQHGVADALSSGEWWAVESIPDMSHEIHLVEYAEFSEYEDPYRKTVVSVAALRTRRLPSLPDNAAETRLRNDAPELIRKYGVRAVFREYDGHCCREAR